MWAAFRVTLSRRRGGQLGHVLAIAWCSRRGDTSGHLKQARDTPTCCDGAGLRAIVMLPTTCLHKRVFDPQGLVQVCAVVLAQSWPSAAIVDRSSLRRVRWRSCVSAVERRRGEQTITAARVESLAHFSRSSFFKRPVVKGACGFHPTPLAASVHLQSCPTGAERDSSSRCVALWGSVPLAVGCQVLPSRCGGSLGAHASSARVCLTKRAPGLAPKPSLLLVRSFIAGLRLVSRRGAVGHGPLRGGAEIGHSLWMPSPLTSRSVFSSAHPRG